MVREKKEERQGESKKKEIKEKEETVHENKIALALERKRMMAKRRKGRETNL
jgi:hypothetical protein